MPDEAAQTASGSYIAQAGDQSTASVTVYQLAHPQPVDDEMLAAAQARLAELPVDSLPEPAAHLPAGSRMAFWRNPLFVGRADDLKQLAKTLKGGGAAAIGQIAAATGLGGIGKTQLAVEFAHRYGQFFAGGVFWLSFASAESIPTEIAQCGRAGGMDLRPDFAGLKLDEQVAAVAAAWQDGRPRLLVFDNCESDTLLAAWRPRADSCRVLLTSRKVEWDAALGVQPLLLGVLARLESIELLRKFRPDLAADDLALAVIAKELADLPLALHLAGSYLQRYRHSELGRPETLLAELRRSEILEHPALQGLSAKISPTGHEHHVARTFAVSYEQLKPDDPTDMLAKRALARAARFAPGESIPRALLTATLELGEADGAGEQAEDALLRLVGLGLLEEESDGALRLHQLLGAFIKSVNPDADGPDAVERVLQQNASRINQAGYPGPLLAWQPHLRWVAETAEQRGSE